MACRLVGLLCETEQLGHVPVGSANTTADIAEILGGVLGARDLFGTGNLAGGYAQAGKFAGLNFLMFAGESLTGIQDVVGGIHPSSRGKLIKNTRYLEILPALLLCTFCTNF